MVSLYSYQLPFKKPFITGKGTFTKREGVIIRYRDDSVDSISEASPLPDFSTESLDSVEQFLIDNLEPLNVFFESDFDLDVLHQKLSSLPQTPSLQFALSTLGIEIICQRKENSISKLFDQPFRLKIPVNTVIGAGSREDVASQIHAGIIDGFSVFKVKVGPELDHLPETLSEINKQFPWITFRLDVNGSWPINKVSEYSAAYKNLPIEYIEEPAAYSSDAELGLILKKCSLPVALDESLKDWQTLHQLLSNKVIAAFVIKPQLYGSILNLFVTFQRKNHLINKFVFSTLLESAAGRNVVGVIAGHLGALGKAHGLHTGVLFDKDIASDFVQNGQLVQNPSTGFGICFRDLNQQQLKKII